MLGERLVAGALLAGERPRQLEERERIASRRLDDLIAPGRKRVPGRGASGKRVSGELPGKLARPERRPASPRTSTRETRPLSRLEC
jgi:hypothetical protein